MRGYPLLAGAFSLLPCFASPAVAQTNAKCAPAEHGVEGSLGLDRYEQPLPGGRGCQLVHCRLCRHCRS